jgi:hypothetical protein
VRVLAWRRGLVALTTAVMCSCLAPAVAQASLLVQPGSFAVKTSSVQAGAHPDLTTGFALTQHDTGAVGALLRDVEVVLPLGFTGYPAAVKTCDPAQLQLGTCPVDAQIGTFEFVLRLAPGDYGVYLMPLFNMVAPVGETAVYGFSAASDVSGEIVVSIDSDSRVRTRVTNIYSIAEVVRQSLTVWGVPADASHDEQRGSKFLCTQFGEHEYFVAGDEFCNHGGAAADEDPAPYLVNPTRCTTEPLSAELEGVISWEGEAAPPLTTDVGPFTGCEALQFAPTVTVAPEETQAISPSGYEVDLHVPQAEGAEGLATADLKDIVVRMPAGVVFSPSAGLGLVPCSAAQAALGSEREAQCPPAAQIGTASLLTPALAGELTGALYLGGPPDGVIPGPPFTLYLMLAGHGTLVKIRGTATPNPATGQVTTVFEEGPELPYSELKLHLGGGSRALLANPSACGSYTAEADLTPWSTPFEPDATPSSPPFQITGCDAPRFEPAFAGSTLSNQAGGYSTFRVTLSRGDSEEDLGGVTVTTPPGLSGNLSRIPLCPEPQASLGTCQAASQIGEETAWAGPGPEPSLIEGGKVYLTGPYDGAPFGLAIDVAERAGPFDLGSGSCDCEVVRASLGVDPRTAQLTIASGPLPAMKDGIPLQVKGVDVDVNRPDFMFNPTNCNPLSVTGTVQSTEGVRAQESSRFQATGCAALNFNPTFAVSTTARASRNDGASLDARLSFPGTALGTEANIALVKLQLPEQLSSRLTTLQQACPAATFEADPAACPAGATVGVARAVSPIIPVALTGPAFFVSHGEEAFPDLVVVLQGYGVTVELLGTTFINGRTGVTTTTFKAVPDVPVGKFELYLPEGPHSALAANGDLCRARPLTMPVELVSQDADVIRRRTNITVTGCPRSTHVSKRGRTGSASRSSRTSRGGAASRSARRREAWPLDRLRSGQPGGAGADRPGAPGGPRPSRGVQEVGNSPVHRTGTPVAFSRSLELRNKSRHQEVAAAERPESSRASGDPSRRSLRPEGRDIPRPRLVAGPVGGGRR